MNLWYTSGLTVCFCSEIQVEEESFHNGIHDRFNFLTKTRCAQYDESLRISDSFVEFHSLIL